MKALVVAAGAPQAALIKELKRRNYEVLLVDRNRNSYAVKFADRFYPISTLDIEGIRNLAQNEKVDFVITVCADQVLLIVAQVCEDLNLPCYIDYATAKNVSNKKYMKHIFATNAIPTSAYVVARELNLEDIQCLNYPLIVKPVDSYSSRGVKKVDCESDLRRAFKEAVALSRDRTAIIEEYAGGVELSVDVYVENKEAHILCVRILDKIPNHDGFVINRGKYPANISERDQFKIQEIAQKIAHAFGLSDTPMLIQMKKDGDKILVIEFCARTGGGIKYRLLPRVSGFDVVKAVVDLTLGEKPHVLMHKYDGYIVDEFIYCNEGVLDHFEGFQDLLDDGVIADYDLYKSKGFKFEQASCSGDRAAYFSVEGRTLTELKEKHEKANKKIKAISQTGKDLIRHEIINCTDY